MRKKWLTFVITEWRIQRPSILGVVGGRREGKGERKRELLQRIRYAVESIIYIKKSNIRKLVK